MKTKTLLLILSLIAGATTVQAQSQLKTVRGKTKEGKSIVVRYSPGAFEDNIESVKYEVIDELQNSLKEQQNKVKNLQSKLDAAETNVKQLKQQIKTNNGDNNTLAQQLVEKDDEIDMLHLQTDSLNQQINSLNVQIDSLNQQINLQRGHNDTLNHYAGSLNLCIDSLATLIDIIELKCLSLSLENTNLNDEINSINKKNEEEKTELFKQERRHIVGIETRMGQVIYGHTVNEGWKHDIQFSKHITAYYGTPQLTKSFPISIEAGAGASYFNMTAKHSSHELMLDEQNDIDNNTYQAQYAYSDLNECLSLVYLDVPVRICFGQPVRGRANVYAKIGLTPSVLLHSGFSGEGTYTLKGYYEDLQVTLEDIPELGFVSDANCYNEGYSPELNRFMLWGNVAAGGYVPFGKWPVQLNFEIKLDYPITPIGRSTENASLPEGAGVLFKGNRVIVPSVAVGLIYQIERKKTNETK